MTRSFATNFDISDFTMVSDLATEIIAAASSGDNDRAEAVAVSVRELTQSISSLDDGSRHRLQEALVLAKGLLTQKPRKGRYPRKRGIPWGRRILAVEIGYLERVLDFS